MERNPQRLSDCFDAGSIGRDGNFFLLDQGDATEPGALVYAAQLNFLTAALGNANVAAMIVSPDLAPRVADSEKAFVISETPRLDFFLLYRKLRRDGWLTPAVEPGRGIDCEIHPDATVSDLARIGDRVQIEAGARIADHSVIGDDVYIGQNAVVGADGLMPVIGADGKANRFSHAGHVEIGERCVVLAGSTIVKSVFQNPTTIGPDSYIGLLSNIGHDVITGSHCVIGGNCVIAGGVHLGAHSEIWASSSVAQGCRIGEKATIHMGSVVVQNVADGESVSGNYAYNHRKHATDHLRRLTKK